MKLTTEQLKQMIKEELKSITESGDWYDDKHETEADMKYSDDVWWQGYTDSRDNQPPKFQEGHPLYDEYMGGYEEWQREYDEADSDNDPSYHRDNTSSFVR